MLYPRISRNGRSLPYLVAAFLTIVTLASCSKSKPPSPPPPSPPPPVTVSGIEVTAKADDFATATQVPKGESVRFTANVRRSDGTSTDESSSATWTSSDTSILAFETTGLPGLATAKKVGGPVTVRAEASGSSGTLSYTVVAAAPVSLAISPAQISQGVPVGQKGTFTATYTMTDKTTQAATDAVNWSSSNGAVVIVGNDSGNKGQAVAQAPGTSNVSASSGSLKSQAVEVKVFQPIAPPQFGVAPDRPQALPLGRTQAFRAVLYYAADDRVVDVTSDVTWQSSNEAIAKFPVDNDIPAGTLIANPTMTGSVTVTAFDPKTATTTAPVTIDITNPAIQSYVISPEKTAGDPLVVGARRQLGVIATFADNIARDITQTVDWSTGDLGHLSVTNGTGKKGVVTANRATPAGTPNDTVVITDPVSSESVSKAIPTAGRILTAIDIAPTGNLDLPLGQSRQFNATGLFSDNSKEPLTTEVTWVTSAGNHVTISNELLSKGSATAVKLGSSAVIGAEYQVGGTVIASNNTVVKVTAPTLDTISIRPTTDVTLALGRTQRLTAWGNYSDGVARDISGLVTWSSGMPSVVSVTRSGKDRGVVRGESVGSASIRAVEPNTGRFSSKAVTVSGKAFDGISITPAGPVSSPIGIVYTDFVAAANFSDGSLDVITEDVQWKSSNPDVATVLNEAGRRGHVLPRAVGSVSITAESDGIVSPGITFNVTSAVLQSITIAPSAVQNPNVGQTIQFSATGTYSDTSQRSITVDATWSSDNPGVAIITNNEPNGQMRAVSPGLAGITAAKDGVTSAATEVVVAGTVTVRSVSDVSGGCCDGDEVTMDGKVAEILGATSYRFEDASGSMPILWGGNSLPLNQDIRVNGVRNSDTGQFTVSSWTPL